MPYCWIDGTLKYILFEQNGQNYITVRGRIDNNQGGSITLENVDRVARGLFFQDLTFQFESIEGFVVLYVQENK